MAKKRKSMKEPKAIGLKSKLAKKKAITLGSKLSRRLSESDALLCRELTARLHNFGIVVTDHFFRAKDSKERTMVADKLKEQVHGFYEAFDDGAGIDCGPLCNNDGDCVPCQWAVAQGAPAFAAKRSPAKKARG